MMWKESLRQSPGIAIPQCPVQRMAGRCFLQAVSGIWKDHLCFEQTDLILIGKSIYLE